MNRRDALKALLAAPLAGALGGCAKHIHRHPLRPAVLRVVLQGPFAVIVHKNEGNRITAYVPVDPDNLHKFRFQKLSMDRTDPHYQFELKTKPDGSTLPVRIEDERADEVITASLHRSLL